MRAWREQERAAVSRMASGPRNWWRPALIVWGTSSPVAWLLLWMVLPAGLPGLGWMLLGWMLGAPLGLFATSALTAGPRATLLSALLVWGVVPGVLAWTLMWPPAALLQVAGSPLLLGMLTWPRLLRCAVLGHRARGWSLPPMALLRDNACPPRLLELVEALVAAPAGEELAGRRLEAVTDPDAASNVVPERSARTPLQQRARALRERARERLPGSPGAPPPPHDPAELARSAGDMVLACRIIAATRPRALAGFVGEQPQVVAEALAWEAPALLGLWALAPPSARPWPSQARALPVSGGVTALQRGMQPYLPYVGTGEGAFKVLSREAGWSLAALGVDEAGVPITAIDADPRSVRLAYGREDGVVALVRVVDGKVVGNGREVAAAPVRAVQFVPGRPWLAAAAASGWLQVMALDEEGLPVRFRQQPVSALARMSWRLLPDGAAAWLLGPGCLRVLRPEQDRTPVSGDFDADWLGLAVEPVSGTWVLGQIGEVRGYGPFGGEPLWRLRGRGLPIDAAFGRAGDWLATVWDSGEVRVHDLQHGSLLAFHRLEAVTGTITFVDEARLVAVGTADALHLLPVHRADS